MPLACSGATEAVPTLLKYSLKMHARIQPCRRILQHPLEPEGEHDEHVAAIQRLTGGRAVLCLAFEDMKVGRWGRELGAMQPWPGMYSGGIDMKHQPRTGWLLPMLQRLLHSIPTADGGARTKPNGAGDKEGRSLESPLWQAGAGLGMILLSMCLRCVGQLVCTALPGE